MGRQDVRVLGSDARLLMRTAEEEVRVAHQVLVQGVVPRHQEGHGGVAAASAPARLLPRAGDASRIPCEQGGVQVADVYAELQCVGRRHAQEPARLQVPLHAPAVLRQIGAPIGRHTLGKGDGLPAQQVPDGPVHQLRHPAGAHEGHGAHLPLDQARHQLGDLSRGALALGHRVVFRVVAEGRVPEGELLAAGRRTVRRDLVKGQPRQASGKVAGVGDGGRAEDELRVGAVACAETPEPADQPRHVGAEDAAVDVSLIQHDEAQAGQRLGPYAVIRQDPDVEHVRVAEDDAHAPANAGALFRRRIAVVDGGPDARAPGRQRVQSAKLVPS